MELLDGEGMGDLVRGQGGIGRAVEVSDAASGSLNTAKGGVLRHGRIAQVIIMQGDGHQTIGWQDQIAWGKGGPILLHAGLVEHDIQGGLNVFLWLRGGLRLFDPQTVTPTQRQGEHAQEQEDDASNDKR